MDKLNKDINEKNEEINQLKSKINKRLKEGFEFLYQLETINNKLNDSILSKNKEKYVYSKKILKENMNESIHKDIIDLFTNVLEDIESINKNNNDFLRRK